VTPRWLELGPAEMAEIRGQSGVQMLTEWLEWERERAKELVLSLTVDGKPEAARLRAGSSITFDHILRSLKTPLAIAALEDEPFKDPARRPSRKDDDAQV